MRQPVPKDRDVSFNPGGACLRLNSALRTSRTALDIPGAAGVLAIRPSAERGRLSKLGAGLTGPDVKQAGPLPRPGSDY